MKGLLFLAAVGWSSLSAQTSSARVEIEALLQAQVDAWNRGDIEGYMQGYWKSDSTMFSSGGSIDRGYNAVLQRYRQFYGTKELMGRLEFNDIDVEFLSPSAAVITGIWKVSRTQNELWGRFTLILQLKREGWRITHDHTSTGN
jgi:beta-aspartyl-peptidase (threonine type)